MTVDAILSAVNAWQVSAILDSVDGWRIFTAVGSACGIIGLLWRIFEWKRNRARLRITTNIGYDADRRPAYIEIIAEHRGGPSVNLVRAGFQSYKGNTWENIFQGKLPHWLYAGNRFFIPIDISIIKREDLSPLKFAFFKGEKNTTYKTEICEQTNKLISES